MRLLNKIKISPFCVLFIIICIFFHLVDEVLILFLFDLIHELSHLFWASIFKFKIKTIELHFYGFSMEMEDLSYKKIMQQVIFYLAGPFSYFISYLLLFSLFKINYISLYQFKVFNHENLFLALFNLLPLYPLDGGRIFQIIYRYNFPLKSAYRFQYAFSGLSLILIFFILLKQRQILFLFLLLTYILVRITTLKKDYQEYLITRSGMKIDFPMQINDSDKIYHFKRNIYLSNGKFTDEKEYLISLLTQSLRKRKKPRNWLNIFKDKNAKNINK